MSSQNFLNGAQLASAQGVFVSAPTVATGAAQNVPHGLGRTPTRVAVIPVIGSDGAGLGVGVAGIQMPAAQVVGVAGATNVVVTAPAAWTGGSFIVIAF